MRWSCEIAAAVTTDADPFSLEEVDSKLCMRRADILQEVVLCVESIALASALVPRMGLMMLHRPEKTNPSCLPMHEIYEARLHGSTAKAKEQAPDPKMLEKFSQLPEENAAARLGRLYLRLYRH